MVQLFLLALYILAVSILVLFGCHKLLLLWLYRKYRLRQPEPPPLPDDWPAVTVQLPLFNEPLVITRLLRAVAGLDYPREKLRIQVLDDSTDRTARLAPRLVRGLRRKGFRIDYIRRHNRRGFKAGALTEGMRRSPDDIFAVFDADFLPEADFLRKTVPHLLRENIGMVQARWGHVNKRYSLLTRLQAILLDGHFLIEQGTRFRSGRFFNFNGTAGLWRRRAIEEAGGWQHDTLTEDLDLSYRAQLAGWRFVFLPEVVVPAELPAQVSAYKIQQHRWAKGSAQTALKLRRKIAGANLPFKIKLEAAAHLGSNFSYLMMTLPALLIIPLMNSGVAATLPSILPFYFLSFAGATLSVILYYGTVIRISGGRLWPDVFYIPLVMALGIGLSLNNGRAVLEALFRHPSEFRRTPKLSVGNRPKKRRRINRRGRFIHFPEGIFALYFLYGCIRQCLMGQFLALPFLTLFLVGFVVTGFNHSLLRGGDG